VAALALGGGAFYLGYARYTTTPTLVGLMQADAEQALDEAELEFEYADPVYATDVPKGQVVTADPGAGSRILPGETVTLTLSLGKLLVPKLRGLTEDAAQDALRGKQLEFGESIGRFSETVPKGTVLASRPAAGTELGTGDSVDLVVSEGRRPLKVGSWVGKTYDEAAAVLEKRGLTPVVADEVFDDEVPKGVVLSHDPADGTLFRGEEVAFVVSLGPELIEVPRVNLSGVDAATETLEDAGFVVEVEKAETYYGLGFVVRSDPEAGSMAPKGSTVTIFVA
jgi:serine/threonine-protein kinase